MADSQSQNKYWNQHKCLSILLSYIPASKTAKDSSAFGQRLSFPGWWVSADSQIGPGLALLPTSSTKCLFHEAEGIGPAEPWQRDKLREA